MKSFGKRMTAIIICIVLLTGIVPVTALAATTVDSGSITGGIQWSLDSNGVLTLSGRGEIKSFNEETPPWYKYSYDITSIVVKDGIIGVGANAFLYSTRATSVTLANSVTFIGDSAFSGCVSLESISFPANLKSIGNDAFYGCSSLEKITLPDGVKYLGDSAFELCAGLISTNFPASIEFIGSDVFKACFSLEKITVASGNKHFSADNRGVLFNKDKSKLLLALVSLSGNYSIPSSVKEINDYAFSNCYYLETVNIPASVTEIGFCAFNGVGSIKAINVDTANKYYSSDARGVLFNKDKTVLYYAPVTISGSYTIPNGVQVIEQEAFEYANKLTKVIIPDSVHTIGDFAFAFTGLTELTLSENLTALSVGMLANTNIKEITIPASVTYISDFTFGSCQQLKNVYFEGNAPAVETESYVFYTDPITIYYPLGNKTWTSEVKASFGQNITWIGYSLSQTMAGDVNCDGKVTNTDLVMIARYIVGLDTSSNIKKYGDMNLDREITNVDVVSVARIIVGL